MRACLLRPYFFMYVCQFPQFIVFLNARVMRFVCPSYRLSHPLLEIALS